MKKVSVWPSGWQNGTMYIDEESVWFFHGEINALFKVNIKTGEIQNKGFVKWEAPFCENLYSSIIKHNEYLFLIPFNASRIAVFDIKNDMFFPVEQIDVTGIKYAVKTGEFLYLFSMYTSDDIIKIDLDSKKIKSHISENHIKKYRRSFTYFVKDEYVYSASENYGMIIKMNMQTDKVEMIAELEDLTGIDSMVCVDKEIIFIDRDYSKVFNYNIQKGVCEKIINLNGKKTVLVGNIGEKIIVETDEYVYLYVFKTDKTLNNETNKILEKKLLNSNTRNSGTLLESKHLYLYYERTNSKIYIFNKNCEIIQEIEPNIDISYLRKINTICDKQEIINEGNTFDLNTFIQIIC